MRILIFGNSLVKEDSLPLTLIPDLKKVFPQIEFLEADPSESIEKYGKDLVILDTVFGIEKITTIEKTEDLKEFKAYSMHDFDLTITLKLLKKIKALDSIIIIGIPSNYKKEKAISELIKIISSLL